MESLEARVLLAADLRAEAIFAPGTPMEYVNAVHDALGGHDNDNAFRLQGSRWALSASGASPNQGDQATVTWSIMPDGTPTDEPNVTSNLIAFMDGIYGTASGPVSNRPWFPIFKSAFDRWSEVSGLKYVYEPADDSAAMGVPGALGVRGDARIGGHLIDGNGGVLAYNYFPEFGGDMIIDTADNYYANNAGGSNLALRNILMHEFGHGLGLSHVEPIDGTKLMEPFINLGFDGPQHDDVLAVQRLYGDAAEPNDTVAQATDLGTFNDGTSVTVAGNSVDDESDVDIYRFRASGSLLLSATVTPAGKQYDEGPQGGPYNPFDSNLLGDLTLQVLDASGTVISTVNGGPAGAIESIGNLKLPAGGDYYLRLSSTSDATQLYALNVSLAAAPPAPRLLAVQANDKTLLEEGQVRHVAPRELRVHFDGGSNLDPATLAEGIRLYRSGRDGNFSNGNETRIAPGFIGLGDTPNVVVLRFAEPLTDDFYRLQIVGTGAAPLKSVNGAAFNDGEGDSELNFRLDLGAQVVSVVPQPIERQTNGTLTQHFNRVVVYFNNDPLDQAKAENPAFYQLVKTGGTQTGDDDQIVLPSSVVYDASKNSATLTFPSALDAALYRLQVGDSTGDDGTILTATNLGTLYNTANDFSTTAFTGDVGSVSNDVNDVDLYRFEVATATTVNVTVTPQPGSGHNTAVRLFDSLGSPIAFADNAGNNPDSFSFALPAADTYYVGVSSSGNDNYNPGTGAGAANGTTTGSYLLEIDVTAAFVTNDDNSSFATATPIGTLGAFEQVIAAQIQPQLIAMRPMPGGIDEPGHRDIVVESHGGGSGVGPVDPSWVTIQTFTFDSVNSYGSYQGNALYNAITEEQKQRAREIFEIYGAQLGIQFKEVSSGGNHWVITGDLRAVDASLPVGPGGVGGVSNGSLAVMDAAEGWPAESPYGGGWFHTAMHEIGHSLGLGHAYDIPSIMGSALPSGGVFPGDNDMVHLRRLYRPDANDIDMYRFTLPEAGRFTAETVAERLPTTSMLNSALRLYRELPGGRRELVAQNDDYNSNDSFLDLDLPAGTYFLGVSSTGNTNYDPNISNSGGEGISDGDYQLKLNFAPTTPGAALMDVTGTPLDGDADGKPGGQFNFWFEGNTGSGPGGNTIYVDKANDKTGGLDGNGSLANPYDSIQAALNVAKAQSTLNDRRVVRIVGNGGLDNNPDTLADNRPYLIGRDVTTLADGENLLVPQDVTVMVDAGAILKFKLARVDVGTSTQGDDRSNGAFQVLGTPERNVYLTSFHNDAVGGNSDTQVPKAVASGDWGGIIFRQDSGYGEDDRPGAPLPESGVFLNSINQAAISYGGGRVFINSVDTAISAIQMVDSRPAVWFNTITHNSDSAIAANPNSFDDRLGRIGPDVYGNVLSANSINGLFVKIETQAGQVVDRLEKFGRFDDTDIVHVIQENLIINGEPGGPLDNVARLDGRLKIDPGITVKLQGARIEAEFGATLIAEGTAAEPVVFTSGKNDRHGYGDVYDTNNDGAASSPQPGDWAGLLFRPVSFGAIDQALISYAGGSAAVPGGFSDFNTVEIHQAQVRLANSRLENNAAGASNATIFIRGAQPVIVNNVIQGSMGQAMSINANSLQDRIVPDPGRSTGPANAFEKLADNRGPLVRLNRLSTNAINGMEVRGEQITTSTIWDDTDIVHVVRNEIFVENFHTATGVRLQSSETESLVVKLEGANAGFTANGLKLDIDDRIGGTVQIVGAIGHPVVLTSLVDDTAGAGFDARGNPQVDTNNDGINTMPGSGTPGTPPPTSMGPLVVPQTTNNANLLRDTLLGPGITPVGSATFTGSAVSAGLFSNGFESIGIESGILLTSGNANFAAGPNTADGSTGTASGAGDAGLNSLFNVTTRDTTALQFDFISQGGDLFFNFVFASEEYNEFANSSFNDVFAFFLDGQNIALIPGTNTPVAINTVNGGRPLGTNPQNPQFYNNNDPSDNGQFLSLLGYDGFTDVFTATATGLSAGQHTIRLVVSDVSDSALDTGVFIQAQSFSDAPVPPVAAPGSGDWRSIRFDKYSNDRNVAVVLEREQAFTDANDVNSTPAEAQYLGQLAKDEKSGDDNLRLGFEVNGFVALDDAGDVDVYSFEAQPGSEVWFDIDRTALHLDTTLELLDGGGNVIASSVNGVRSGAALDSVKDPVLGGDFFSSNRHDGGIVYDEDFRAILPGNPAVRQNYYLRVSSAGGASRGEYQLNIRLRQVDNFAGSTVRYADVRYATNGIEVLGVPYHSPLLAESAETPTDNTTSSSNANAQALGNLLTSDRNTLSVGGVLGSPTDVDWYSFELGYNLVQAIGGVNAGAKTFATMFDIDFADGISRADTVLSIFDDAGRLILMSRDSNVQDDQPAPGQGIDSDDLNRGSFGKLDPFIGSQQMPAAGPGSTFRYYVAVSSNQMVPAQVDATLRVNGTNTLARLEPINSVQRIVEDHIGSIGYDSNGTQRNPTTGAILPINNAAALRTRVVPYTLSDVVLFVASGSTLYTVNPFTGQTVTTVGSATGTGSGYGDIAMRPDGRLVGQTRGTSNAAVGHLHELNTASGGVLQDFGDDGLNANGFIDQAYDALAVRRLNVGSYELYTAKNRTADDNGNAGDGSPWGRAIYRLNTGGGVIDENAGTAGFIPWAPLPSMTSDVTGMAWVGSSLYAVDDAGHLWRYTGVWTDFGQVAPAGLTGLALGPQNLDVLNNQDVAAPFGFPDEAADGNAAVSNVFFATGADGRLYAFDITGAPRNVFDSNSDGVADAANVNLGVGGGTRGLAFSNLDFNLWHPTEQRGNDEGHGINAAFDNSREGDNGEVSFYFGLEQYQASNQDYRTYGSSGQYGVLSSTTHEELSTNTLIRDNYNLPGGAQGALMTDAFSLAGYNRKDKPTLYFNYFLATQNAQSNNDNNAMRDSARVYITTNNGATWSLLATNNSYQDEDAGQSELPEYLSEARDERLGDSRQRVQELFETSQWRQARIDLAEFAGQGQLKLRFEFSTAGSFNMGLTGDAYGNVNSNQRGQSNSFEGFYVDDIIVGFTERGEMVTGAQPDRTSFFNKYSQARSTPPMTVSQALEGPYQLEIRRGTEYGANVTPIDPEIAIYRTFDTNDRLIRENPFFDRLGDRNLTRDQGHIQIENNFISGALEYGIVVAPGTRDSAGNLPYPGAPQKTVVLNNERLAPGVAIVNNVISTLGDGGIRFSGDANANNGPLAATPFGRILNNTIYGGTTATGTGILVETNASPTILNNIFANLTAGITISGAPVAPVANFNLFQAAPTAPNGHGPDDFTLAAGAPLFVNPSDRNFYLAPSVVAIDSSINSLEDRVAYVGVKTPLGIPQSVIRAPDRDVYGQRRIDVMGIDPTGQGSQVFKDRGAVEAADVDRPYAELVNPVDNDIAGLDIDPGRTFVHLRDGLIERFQILLGDGLGPEFPFRGAGLDPATVLSEAVRVRQDGRTLTAGVHYNFGYSVSSGIIELTPLSGIWSPNSVYTIDLNNRVEFTITAPSGLGAADGDQFVIVDEQANRVTFEFDSGYTLRLPRTLEIVVSPLGGQAGGVDDGQTFDLDDGTTTVTFEFDSTGSLTDPLHVAIPFSQAPAPSSADAIAAAIVAAIQASGLAFAPTVKPGGIVHLGSSSEDSVDTANAPSLTVTGVAGGVEDGQYLTIRNGNFATLTFEFTTDAGLTFPGNVPVLIQPEDDVLEIAAKLAAAINGQAATLDLAAIDLMDGRVHLGGRAPTAGDPGHLVDTTHTVVTQTGQPGVDGNLVMHLPGGKTLRLPADGGAIGAVRDGDTFTVNDGTNVVIFEFDSNNSQNVPLAVRIPFSDSPNPTSASQLAANIIGAVGGSSLVGVTAAIDPAAPNDPPGSVRVRFSGPPNLAVNASGAPSIFQPFDPGQITDGEQFTISVNGVDHVFEFDSNGSSMAPNVISFAGSNTAAILLSSIRAAILNAGIGLNPTILSSTDALALNATPQHTLDTTGTRISQDGVPGGAIPVAFVPSVDFTAEQMARRIFDAILSTSLLTGVSVELDDTRIIAEGVANILGIQIQMVDPIADLAGNPIAPNRPDLSTKFTIVMPGVELDYGDHPSPYPTTLLEDGARHAIIPGASYLGSGVDANADGVPSLGATSDDNDFTLDLASSRLTSSARPPYIVTVSGGGTIQDGDTFTIDIGNGPVAFEFDLNNGGLNNPLAKPIVYTAGDTANDIANAMVNAINAAEVQLGLIPVNLGGGQVLIGGQAGDTVVLNVTGFSFTDNLPQAIQTPGAGISLQLPETLQLHVPAGGGAAISDASKFSISDGVTTVQFEFDSTSNWAPTNTRIQYLVSDTQAQIAQKVIAAINASAVGAGLTPADLGGGVIHLASMANHSVAITQPGGVTVTGQPGSVADGDSFSIDEDGPGGAAAVVFEFENTAINDGVSGSNIAIAFNPTMTREEIAQAIVNAINGAAGLLDVTAVHLGGGSIEVDGTNADSDLDFSGTPALAVSGEAGGVSDGHTFTLHADGQDFVFEFDRDGNVALNHRPVVFAAGDDADALGAALAAALGALPEDSEVQAVHEGGGVVSVSRDDEDGVSLTRSADGNAFPLLNEHVDTQFQVVASGPGFLNAWVDYNHDGDWDDPGEHIFVDVALVAGVNADANLVTRVPAGAVPGATFARFRFSSVRGLAPTGLAEDGEVEDYLLNVLDGEAPQANDDNSIYTVSEDGQLVVPAAQGVLVNDQDGDNDPNLVVFEVNGQMVGAGGLQITLASGALLTISADGSFSYDPSTSVQFNALAVGEVAEDTFTYRISDQTAFGGLPSNQATVAISVTGENDAPTATDNEYATLEESPVSGNVLTDGVPDSDPDVNGSAPDDVLTVVAYDAVSAKGAVVQVSADGTFTYDPSGSLLLDELALGEVTTDTFEYTISDGNGGMDTATVTITVTGENDAPVALNVSVDIDEDSPPLTFSFNADDIDSDDNPGTLSYFLRSVPSEGAVTLAGVGQFTFNPFGPDAIADFQDLAEGETRTVFFTYDVRDAHGVFSNPGTVTVTIHGTNDAPVASNVSANAFEDGTPVSGMLIADDIDSDDNPNSLTYLIVGQPSEGAVSNVGRTFTFNPGSDFQDLAIGETRLVTFTYQALDAHGALSNLATGSVTVTGVNDAPVAQNVTGLAIEDGAPVLVSFNADDVDSDDSPASLTYFIQIPPVEGSATVDSAGSFIFAPGADFQDLAVGEMRDVVFTYYAVDRNGAASNLATVTMTVEGVNDNPTADPVSTTAVEDGTAVTAAFSADDVDSDDDPSTLNYLIVTQPSEGSVVANGDGTFTFDPGPDFQDLAMGQTRVVTFQYQVEDSHGALSDSATATITVTGVNDAPTTVDVTAAATEDGPMITGFFGGDDVDTDNSLTNLTYEILTPPTEGAASVVIPANGRFRFDPAGAFQDLALGETRNVVFTYRAIDVHGASSNVSTVTITVTGVNDAPVANNGSIGVTEDGGPVQELFPADDIDSNDDPTTLTYTVVDQPDEGLVIVDGDGLFTFEPGSSFQDLADGETRVLTFTYTATDQHGLESALATITVTVTGVNDAPTANPSTAAAQEDGLPVALTFTGDDVDSDDDPSSLTFEIDAQPVEGRVLSDGSGGFVFDPAGDFQDLALGETRDVTFTYVAVDSHGLAGLPATVTVTVTGVNDAPVANSLSVGAVEDAGPVTAAFAGDDIDSDDDQSTLIYTLLGQPSEGFVVNHGNGTFSFDPGADFQDLRTGETRAVTFSYLATDSHNAVSASGVVTVTVTGTNEPPVANPDSGSTFRNMAGTFNLAINDRDPDGSSDANGGLDLGSIEIVAPPANGTVMVNGDGTVTYTPKSNFAGLDAFTYRIRDLEGALSNEAVVSVRIFNPPDSWQNPDEPLDVNADGVITVLDALLVVNDLRDNQAFTGGQTIHDLNDLNQLQVAPFRKPFVDPSGDGLVTVSDLLMIINHLRTELASAGAEPEGERDADLQPASKAPFAPVLASSPEALPAPVEEETWSEPLVVAAVVEDLPPLPATIAEDQVATDDWLADDEDASDLEDALTAIADDVAGRWIQA